MLWLCCRCVVAVLLLCCCRVAAVLLFCSCAAYLLLCCCFSDPFQLVLTFFLGTCSQVCQHFFMCRPQELTLAVDCYGRRPRSPMVKVPPARAGYKYWAPPCYPLWRRSKSPRSRCSTLPMPQIMENIMEAIQITVEQILDVPFCHQSWRKSIVSQIWESIIDVVRFVPREQVEQRSSVTVNVDYALWEALNMNIGRQKVHGRERCEGVRCRSVSQHDDQNKQQDHEVENFNRVASEIVFQPSHPDAVLRPCRTSPARLFVQPLHPDAVLPPCCMCTFNALSSLTPLSKRSVFCILWINVTYCSEKSHAFITVLGSGVGGG